MIEVAKATLSDAGKIVTILEEARRLKLQLSDESWGHNPFTIEEVLRSIKHSNSYIAKRGEEYVGTFVLVWSDKAWGSDGEDNNAGYVHLLATPDSVRGQKMGITRPSYSKKT
jgi:hypothetical protein